MDGQAQLGGRSSPLGGGGSRRHRAAFARGRAEDEADPGERGEDRAARVAGQGREGPGRQADSQLFHQPTPRHQADRPRQALRHDAAREAAFICSGVQAARP